MNGLTLEICTADIDSVKAAAAGGAQRVELCSGLAEGGVTPSVGLIRESRKVEGLKLHVLIRPRGGDFIYSPAEVDCMADDVETAVNCGADGVVIGALKPDGSIDTETCRRLIEKANGKSVTFHRAFDLCRDPEGALGTIIALGCDRILTSGQQANAEAGIEMLRKLVRLADGRISIMAGSGVSPENAGRIVAETGCRELHASARSTIGSEMTYRNPGVAMGTPGSDEYARKVTDPAIVAGIISAMRAQSTTYK